MSKGERSKGDPSLLLELRLLTITIPINHNITQRMRDFRLDKLQDVHFILEKINNPQQ